MELLTLSLENFQGLKHEEIQLDGHSASIYGRNASGKTTIFNAITWLLFGKPSTWAKNWDPKTKGPNGDLHNLEHSATGTFRLDDGQTVTLKKVFREVWKRKRGSAAEEYSGNTIDYQINGVPCKEKEYMAAVQEYCSGEETMKLLTMPDYFPSVMDWQKRREILLDICGDVSDADVIASTPELAGLPEFLKMPGSTTRLYKVDEYRKIAAAKKTDLNKKIEAIPNRIDEASRAIDKNLPTPEDLAAKLAAAEAEETKIAEEKRAILAGDTSELRSSLANAKADYAAAKAEYIEEGSEARAEHRKAQEKAETELLEAKTEAANATADARRKKADLEHMKARRAEILAEYKEAAAETWDEHREICPTCGQALPEEKVEELRADFLQRRSAKLEAINAKGKKEASKEAIAQLERDIADLEEKATAAEARADEIYTSRKETIKAEPPRPDFSETDRGQAIAKTIQTISGQIEAAEQKQSAALREVNERQQAAMNNCRQIRYMQSQAEAAQRQRQRITELEAEEKSLAAEYEKTEQGVYLCEVFVKTKVALLTERINSKFKSVSFQLFQEQTNGGVADCCEVLVPGEGGAMVPYSTANKAAVVNAGLEIIATLSHHYGVRLPIVVDNAESVTELLPVDSQVIRLVVSAEDESLRVEVDK